MREVRLAIAVTTTLGIAALVSLVPSTAVGQGAAGMTVTPASKDSLCARPNQLGRNPAFRDTLFTRAVADTCDRAVYLYSSDGKYRRAYPIEGKWAVYAVQGTRVVLVGGVRDEALVLPFDLIADVLVGKDTDPPAQHLCVSARCKKIYGSLSIILKPEPRPPHRPGTVPTSPAGGALTAAPSDSTRQP